MDQARTVPRENKHHSAESLDTNKIVSKEAALKHYQWGNKCEGWELVSQQQLSVKLEKMPPFTAELKHYHRNTAQFFFILKGKAMFEIGDQRLMVKANQGITIGPMQVHKVINESNSDLEFILSSHPAVGDDRVNCE